MLKVYYIIRCPPTQNCVFFKPRWCPLSATIPTLKPIFMTRGLAWKKATKRLTASNLKRIKAPMKRNADHRKCGKNIVKNMMGLTSLQEETLPASLKWRRRKKCTHTYCLFSAINRLLCAIRNYGSRPTPAVNPIQANTDRHIHLLVWHKLTCKTTQNVVISLWPILSFCTRNKIW